jgi:hypothetical protein
MSTATPRRVTRGAAAVAHGQVPGITCGGRPSRRSLHVLVPEVRGHVPWCSGSGTGPWRTRPGRWPFYSSRGGRSRCSGRRRSRPQDVPESERPGNFADPAPRAPDGRRCAERTIFGLPGLPAGVSPRAAKLMARADVVASVIEVTRYDGSAGATLDPRICSPWRARCAPRGSTAVDHAMRELLR